MSRRAAWLRAPQWSSWTATLRWSFGAEHVEKKPWGDELWRMWSKNNWKTHEKPMKNHTKPMKYIEIHWDTTCCPDFHVLFRKLWRCASKFPQREVISPTIPNDTHLTARRLTAGDGSNFTSQVEKNLGKMLVDWRFSWSKWIKMIYFMTPWQCFLWFSGFVRWYHWVSGMVQGPGCILSLCGG